MAIVRYNATLLGELPKLLANGSLELALLGATAAVAVVVIDYQACQAWDTLKAGFERNNRNCAQYLYEWAERESNKQSIKAMP